MKKSASKIVLILSLIAVLIVGMALVACTDDKPDDQTGEKKIYISSRVQTLKEGVNAPITVVTTPDGEDWDITISDPTLVAYDQTGGYLYVVGRVTEATEVTVTVSLTTDPTVTASKSFAVIASGRDSASFIVLTADKYTIAIGDPARLEVISSNDEAYTVTVSDTSIATCRNNVLTVVEAPEEDTTITVTVALESDPTIKASKTFTVKAKEEASTISLKSDVDELADVKAGESKKKAQLTVTTSVDGAAYTLTASSDKIKINDDNTVEINGEIPYDTRVSITARLTDNPDVCSTIDILLRALQKEGQVSGGNGLTLTTAMLNTITNPSITATGTVVDYYEVYGDSTAGYVTSYDTYVVMSDGKWKGTWKITGKADGTAITDMYVKGTNQVNYAYDKSTQAFFSGTDMYKVYIGKDNTVERKLVVTTDSIPAAWEEQHLYNPMEHFATNVSKKFEYREDFDLTAAGYNATEYAAFKYIIDTKDVDDWYYATYISYAFTPMVSDTLENIYVIVGANGIVGIVAETEHITYGGTDEEGNPIEDESPTSESYTIVSFKFSDIGTSVVTDPAPYVGTIANPTTKSERESNEAMEALSTMISNMHGATNYTFNAVDTTTYSPSLDESDYQISSSASYASSPSNASSSSSTHPYAQQRFQDATIGTVGLVTEDAILLAVTDKYSYGMSGDLLYYTNYSGYKQITKGDNAVYDVFSFSYEADALAGTKQVAGNVTDIIPQFRFAADIFKYKSSTKVETSTGGDVYVYELTLRDVTIAKDVALELSMYRYAEDAAGDIGSSFSLWVDEHGNLVKSVYQYSYASDMYQGYVETTYTNLGTTVIPDNAFDGYVPRVRETSWDQYTDTRFYKKHSTLCSSYNCLQENGEYDHSGHTGTVAEVLEYIFPTTYASVPAPSVFTDIFGDNLFVPGLDWKTEYASDGTETGYRDYMSFTMSYDKSDENSKILQSDYQELMQKLETALNALGYTKSSSNSNTEKDPLLGGSRYATFINSSADIQIVIENNYTRYFWVSVYHMGDWVLSK